MILAPPHVVGEAGGRNPKNQHAGVPAGRPAGPALLSHTSGMGETPLPRRSERAAVYWRRRAAVLVISMSVVAGITWSAAAVLGAGAKAGQPSASRDRILAQASQQGSRAGGSAGVSNGVAAVSRLAVPVRPAGPSCPASDVMLTLTATQARYSARQQPEFAVDVVSSANFPCSFDVGAGHVLLGVWAGRVQVWTSADCAEGLASQPVTLHKGVPAVVAMTWDEQYSAAGCPVPGRPAPAGTYTAKATGGSAVSNDVTVTIG